MRVCRSVKVSKYTHCSLDHIIEEDYIVLIRYRYYITIYLSEHNDHVLNNTDQLHVLLQRKHK